MSSEDSHAMTEKAVSRYPVPDIKDMPDNVREAVLAVQEKAGFVPNVFLVLAYRPDEFRAFMGNYMRKCQSPVIGKKDVAVSFRGGYAAWAGAGNARSPEAHAGANTWP